MKTKILSIALIVSIMLTGIVSNAADGKRTSNKKSPQEKVMNDFNATFALTPEVTVLNKGFVASAVVDGRKVSSAYNKRGNKIYTIVRYTSSGLNKEILDAVKTKYDRYFVTSMEKIQQPGFDDVYLVHLINDASIKTVKVTDDGLELLQNLKNS